MGDFTARESRFRERIAAALTAWLCEFGYGRYRPNVLMLGHDEWTEMLHIRNVCGGLVDLSNHDGPRFMGMDIERVNKEYHLSIGYRILGEG